MGNMVNRAKLRGKPLDEDCKTARTTTHEYGPVDDRVFCRGIFDRRNDAPIGKCYGCKAFVENATPIWEESAADKEKTTERYIKLPQPEYLPPSVEELEAFATKLYQSPIEIIMQEMQTQFDGEVFKATQAYGINVDKDELIKALQYDRDQYNKGFADGSRIDTTAIRAEVAREIFEEIEEIADTHYGTYSVVNTKDYFDLKKKYTEGEK